MTEYQIILSAASWCIHTRTIQAMEPSHGPLHPIAQDAGPKNLHHIPPAHGYQLFLHGWPPRWQKNPQTQGMILKIKSHFLVTTRRR